MSRIKVTPEDVDAIREAWSSRRSVSEIADYFGCCIDTAKRILVRHDIADFSGAKFVPSALTMRRQASTWDRPCIKCGEREERPRLQFLCSECTSLGTRERDDGNFIYI